MRSNLTGKKAQSRQRIVEAASRAVRRAGFEGVSVASVMKDAGMTHGGFYAHFASRDALLAEALVQASAATGDGVRLAVQALARGDRSAFRAFVEIYLSNGQIGDCENGCPVAALCSDMPGQSAEVVDVSRRIVGALHGLVAQVMPAGSPADAAWAVTSTIVGAVQLARVIGDDAQGRAVLASARAQLLAAYDKPH